MKIYLDSIGCRLNQSEIETIAGQFKAAGHFLVSSPDQADLAVVNTCAVTAAAASDSRGKIRQIAVTGCWSTLEPASAASLPGVSHVIPNARKDRLVADLLQIPEETFDLEPVAREPVPGTRLRTRSFIKVQDGCDNRCTFCITTIARGRARSRPLSQILASARAAIADGAEKTGGAKELVLTGVHLGAWGQDLDPPRHLRDLVRAILANTDVPRLRLSSLEPWDLDDAFFSLWEDSRLCRHLHLPLQSGSAATLRRMARKTTPETFLDLVSAARRRIPNVAITTDLIAGFPSETEVEFAETVEFVRQVQFAGGHVFPFSPRPGTAAARMPGQVPERIRKERGRVLRTLLAESACLYRQGFIGQNLPVLWESLSAIDGEFWTLTGLTDNYLRVEARADRLLWNQITGVRLAAIEGDRFMGQIIENEVSGQTHNIRTQRVLSD
jgi:threonylcarbamoyladenosine tRNA methylthiotransferase MtaB